MPSDVRPNATWRCACAGGRPRELTDCNRLHEHLGGSRCSRRAGPGITNAHDTCPPAGKSMPLATLLPAEWVRRTPRRGRRPALGSRPVQDRQPRGLVPAWLRRPTEWPEPAK